MAKLGSIGLNVCKFIITFLIIYLSVLITSFLDVCCIFRIHISSSHVVFRTRVTFALEFKPSKPSKILAEAYYIFHMAKIPVTF